jgi:hypothetical protein
MASASGMAYEEIACQKFKHQDTALVSRRCPQYVFCFGSGSLIDILHDTRLVARRRESSHTESISAVAKVRYHRNSHCIPAVVRRS